LQHPAPSATGSAQAGQLPLEPTSASLAAWQAVGVARGAAVGCLGARRVLLGARRVLLRAVAAAVARVHLR
jgi:hypothetical protein